MEKDKLFEKVKVLTREKKEEVRNIEFKYQSNIDNLIDDNMPFEKGDIITHMFFDEPIYFMYKGIIKEHMKLIHCDKNGIGRDICESYHWTLYDKFNL